MSTGKTTKLAIPATIIIASLILGGFYYISQVNKQKSIERQQEIKIEQENKEFIAKRKVECLAIYKTESDKFNNVQSWRYIEPLYDISDACEIIYKGTDGKNFSKYF